MTNRASPSSGNSAKKSHGSTSQHQHHQRGKQTQKSSSLHALLTKVSKDKLFMRNRFIAALVNSPVVFQPAAILLDVGGETSPRKTGTQTTRPFSGYASSTFLKMPVSELVCCLELMLRHVEEQTHITLCANQREASQHLRNDSKGSQRLLWVEESVVELILLIIAVHPTPALRMLRGTVFGVNPAAFDDTLSLPTLHKHAVHCGLNLQLLYAKVIQRFISAYETRDERSSRKNQNKLPHSTGRSSKGVSPQKGSLSSTSSPTKEELDGDVLEEVVENSSVATHATQNTPPPQESTPPLQPQPPQPTPRVTHIQFSEPVPKFNFLSTAASMLLLLQHHLNSPLAAPSQRLSLPVTNLVTLCISILHSLVHSKQNNVDFRRIPSNAFGTVLESLVEASLNVPHQKEIDDLLEQLKTIFFKNQRTVSEILGETLQHLDVSHRASPKRVSSIISVCSHLFHAFSKVDSACFAQAQRLYSSIEKQENVSSLARDPAVENALFNLSVTLVDKMMGSTNDEIQNCTRLLSQIYTFHCKSLHFKENPYEWLAQVCILVQKTALLSMTPPIRVFTFLCETMAEYTLSHKSDSPEFHLAFAQAYAKLLSHHAQVALIFDYLIHVPQHWSRQMEKKVQFNYSMLLFVAHLSTHEKQQKEGTSFWEHFSRTFKIWTRACRISPHVFTSFFESVLQNLPLNQMEHIAMYMLSLSPAQSLREKIVEMLCSSTIEHHILHESKTQGPVSNLEKLIGKCFVPSLRLCSEDTVLRILRTLCAIPTKHFSENNQIQLMQQLRFLCTKTGNAQIEQYSTELTLKCSTSLLARRTWDAMEKHQTQYHSAEISRIYFSGREFLALWMYLRSESGTQSLSDLFPLSQDQKMAISLEELIVQKTAHYVVENCLETPLGDAFATLQNLEELGKSFCQPPSVAHSQYSTSRKLTSLYTLLMNRIQLEQYRIIRLESDSGYSPRAVTFFVENSQTCLSWFRRLSPTLLRTSFVSEMHSSVIMHARSLLDFANNAWWKTSSAFAVPKKCTLTREELFMFATSLLSTQEADGLTGLLHICDSSLDSKAHMFVSACLQAAEGGYEEALLTLTSLLQSDDPSSPLSPDCVTLVSARLLQLYRQLNRWEDFRDGWLSTGAAAQQTAESLSLYSNALNTEYLHNLQLYSQIHPETPTNSNINHAPLLDAQFELSTLQMTLDKKSVNVITKREKHFLQILDDCCSVLQSAEFGECLPVLVQFATLQTLRNIQDGDQLDVLPKDADTPILFQLLSSLYRIVDIAAERSERHPEEHHFQQRISESLLELTLRLGNRDHAQTLLNSLVPVYHAKWKELLLGTQNTHSDDILSSVHLSLADVVQSERDLSKIMEECCASNASSTFQAHYRLASQLHKTKLLPALSETEHLAILYRSQVKEDVSSISAEQLENLLRDALRQHFSASPVYCTKTWIREQLYVRPEVLLTYNEIYDLFAHCSQSIVKVFGNCVDAYLQALKFAPPSAHHFFAEISLILLDFLVKCAPLLHADEVAAFTAEMLNVPHHIWQHVVPQLVSLLKFESIPIVQEISKKILLQIGETNVHTVVFDLCAESVHTGAEMAKRDILENLSAFSPSHASVIHGVTFLFHEMRSVALSHEEKWIYQLNAIQKRFKHQFKQFEHELQDAKRQNAWGSSIPLHTLKTMYTLFMVDIAIFLKTCIRLTFDRKDSEHSRIGHYREDLDQLTEIILAPCSPENDLQGFQIYDQFLAAATSLQKKLQHAAKKVVDLRKISSLCSERIAMHSTPVPSNTLLSSGNNDEPLSIASIYRSAEILSSKTQPKKLKILANDGSTHTYLLKSKEDLHLDQRVMQFLHITNCFLDQDAASRSRRLHASHYSVIPLDSNCGLIQWVDDTFPVLALYREKAQAKGTSFRPQDDFFNKLIPLLKNDKRFAQSHSSGRYPKKLLRKVVTELIQESDHDLLDQRLRVSSGSSYDYFVTNTTFNDSAAVMSIIGYVIGLGDRHLDNILVNFATGAVTHIDFNVCFDKGMKLKIPEIVPFRLTPVIRRALGVTGTEGAFSSAANVTTKVIENNADTLMMLLASFVHDPLVEWTHANVLSKYFCSSIPVSETNLSVICDEFVSFLSRYSSFLEAGAPQPQSIALLQNSLSEISSTQYNTLRESLLLPHQGVIDALMRHKKEREGKQSDLDALKTRFSTVTAKEVTCRSILSNNSAESMMNQIADFSRLLKDKLTAAEDVQGQVAEYNVDAASKHIASLGKRVESFEAISTLCANEIIPCHKETSVSKLRKLEKNIHKHLKQKLKEDQRLLHKLDLYQSIASSPFTSIGKLRSVQQSMEKYLTASSSISAGEVLCDDVIEKLSDFVEAGEAQKTLQKNLISFTVQSITQLCQKSGHNKSQQEVSTPHSTPPNLSVGEILLETVSLLRESRTRLHPSAHHLNRLHLMEQLKRRCVLLLHAISDTSTSSLLQNRVTLLLNLLTHLLTEAHFVLNMFTTQTIVGFVKLFANPEEMRTTFESSLQSQDNTAADKCRRVCDGVSSLVPSLYVQCERLYTVFSHFRAQLSNKAESTQLLDSCFNIGTKMLKEVLHMSEHIAETNCITICHNLNLQLEKILDDVIEQHILPGIVAEIDSWQQSIDTTTLENLSCDQILVEWDEEHAAVFTHQWHDSPKQLQNKQLLDMMKLWLQSLCWNSDTKPVLGDDVPSFATEILSQAPTRAEFLHDLRQVLARVHTSSQQLVDYFDKYLVFEHAAARQLHAMQDHDDRVRAIQQRDVSFKQLDHFDSELHELMKSIVQAENLESLHDHVRSTVDTLTKIPHSLHEWNKYNEKLARLENSIISFEKQKSTLIVEIRQIRDEEEYLDNELRTVLSQLDVKVQVVQLCESIGNLLHLDVYLHTLRYIVDYGKTFITWLNMHQSRIHPTECVTKPNDLSLVMALAEETLCDLQTRFTESQKWLHEDAPKSGPLCALYLLDPEHIREQSESLRDLLWRLLMCLQATQTQAAQGELSVLGRLDTLLRGLTQMEWLTEAQRRNAYQLIAARSATNDSRGDSHVAEKRDQPFPAEQQHKLFLDEYCTETLPRIRARMNHFGVPVEDHVRGLIKDATNIENLCQLYEGWSPWL